MKINPDARRTLAAMVLALAATAASAQAHDEPRHLSDLEAAGAVLMDDVNTPLLHHAATGEPYDLRVLARGDEHTNIARPERPLRNKIESRDEFVRQDALPAWGAFVEERVALVRGARAYLIPMQASWGEFDFGRSQFPVQLQMNRRGFRAGPSYHCAGTYSAGPNRSFKTACLHAVNEDQNDPFLRAFPIADHALARELRNNRYKYLLFALAEPAAKYKVLKGNEIRYMPLEIYAASGFQPVRITELILATSEGDIVAISRKAGERAQTAPGAEVSTTLPGAPAAPGAVSATVPGAAGLPAGWTMVARDEVVTLYADPSSVRRQGPVVMLRAMMDLNTPAASGMRSSVALYEHDCGKRTTRVMRDKGYSERYGRGATVGETREPQAPNRPAGGTIGESMFNYACNAAAVQ